MKGSGPDDDDRALAGEAAADVDVVARGGAVQIAGQITQRGVSFIFSAVAVHLLGRAGFGLYSQIARVLAIGGQLGLAGFNYASMRFIARARATADPGGVRGAARVGLWGAGIASAVFCAGLFLSADALAGVFAQGRQASRQPLFADLLRIGAAYIPLFALMQVLRYCTQAYKTMVPSVIVGNIVQPAARFLVGVALLVAGFEVTGAVSSLAVSMGIGAGAGIYFYRRMLTPEEASAPPLSQPGAMVRFALPQGGSSLLGVQSLGLGVIMLGLLLDRDGPVGLFAIALALQGPGGLFLSGIVNIWAPVVSDLYESGSIERLDSLYKTITRWVVTFSFPVYALLIFMPDLMTRIYAGSDELSAAPLVVILAIGNLFYSGTGPTGYVISMSGRPGVNFANSIVAVALYVIGGIILVPKLGARGMAITDAAVTALVNSVRVVEAKVLIGVQPFGRSVLKPVAATVVGAAVLIAWRLVFRETVPIQVTGVVAAAGAYIGCLWLLGLDPEERYVWERIKKRALRSRGR